MELRIAYFECISFQNFANLRTYLIVIIHKEAGKLTFYNGFSRGSDEHQPT